MTLTFSRLEKPLYSTRIIKGDRNPVFEETAVLLIDVNTVKLREKLSFQLWDSDRMSVVCLPYQIMLRAFSPRFYLLKDDMLGYVEVDIIDLIRKRGKPVRRISPLTSPDSRDRPGQIDYTVGYYGKVSPNKALMTDGSDPSLANDLREQPEFKDARAVALNDLEAAVLVTPPDPEWPCGVLSMQVHEVRDLAAKTTGKERKGCNAKEGQKGQDDGEETAEEAEGLPSSYCTMCVLTVFYSLVHRSTEGNVAHSMMSSCTKLVSSPSQAHRCSMRGQSASYGIGGRRMSLLQSRILACAKMTLSWERSF